MKNLFPIIMPLVMLTVLVTSNIYLTRRFGWAFDMDNRTLLHIIFAAVTVFMFAGLIGFSNATSLFGTLLYAAAAFLTGFMLYLLLSLLLVDLVNLFAHFRPVTFGLLSIGLATAISLYGLINAPRTVVTPVEVALQGITRPVKIAHLSDIHLGHFRGKANLEKLVQKSMAGMPDMLVITGDLFDGKRQIFAETLEPLKGLGIPVYFVEGNHDNYSGVEKIKSLLREAGVIVLENEVVQEGELQIVGLNHMKSDKDTESIPPNPSAKSIEEVLGSLQINESMPALLLHHSPDGMKHASAAGIDLYLSGHTHAGQLFPMNHLNDALFTYNRGLDSLNGTKIYVSRGTGTFGPPMRVGTTGEIPIITLRPVAK